MKCKKCGKDINCEELFCGNCGTKIDNCGLENTQNETFSNFNEITFGNQKLEQINVQYKGNTTNSNKALISLILGVVSVLLSIIFNIFIIPVAIAGLVLGIVEENKNGKKIAGIVLNSVAIILSIFTIITVSFITKEKNFNGDGYKLTYNINWGKGTVSDKDALIYYTDNKSYFLPLGRSPILGYSCDFEESECKKQLYGEFYDYWQEDLNKSSLNIYKDNYSFNLLKDDIYYASYSYGESSTDLEGRIYLLVSKDKDVILSFIVRCNDSKNIDKMDDAVLKLLKTIEIEKNNNSSNDKEDNVIYDDKLYESIDSMSNWNMYSDLRNGKLGKVSDINGGWRILSNSEVYWEFKNGKFYFYKSVNDLTDNYWYGTTKILTGKKGFKSIGLDEDKIDNIVSKSNGLVSYNDIYTIICTPTKIISGGVDKSDTNIPKDFKLNYVWIIVDHGEDGIEAQVMNVDSYDTSYYIKISD